MSLTNLSVGAFALGLLAVAAVLFALQRLRVRHRDVTVVTTMFWHQAVEEARARVLVRRFRHPWAYALAVAIATLLWAVVAGPRLDGREGRRHVLLLDGSAAMATGDRFARAVEALSAARAARPDDRTTVLFCGATVETILREGESEALLERRLAGIEPDAAPATVESTVRALAAAADAAETSVVVFGDAPVREEAVALAPDGMTVTRAKDDGAGAEAPARIVALGASEAASGDWTGVDLLVAVEGASAASLRLDGAPIDGGAETMENGGVTRVVLRDVPARGQVVTASLGALDRALALPDRTPVRVAVDPALEELVVPLLVADRAVVLTTSDAVDGTDVVIARAAAAPTEDGSGPARLTFVPDAAAADAFVVRDPAAVERPATDRALRALVETLGLQELDAAALATRTGRTIGLTVEPAAARGLVVRDALLGPESEFTRSRSFPTFLARAVRWLVDRAPLRPDPVAGRALEDVDALVDPEGRRVAAAGLDVVPLRAGLHAAARGAVIAVALPVPRARPEAGGDLAPAEDGAAASVGDLATWLLLLAFAVLGVEWWLHRTGRMP